ncbi:MAG: hypothetical protein ACYDBW_01640 [Sulfuricaulis sp.]
MTIARLVTVLLLIAPWRVSVGCGVCVEDKVAATYDYRVTENAARQGNGIAYTEIAGSLAGAVETVAAIQQVVERTPGVIPGSVRLSAAPPAVSFVWDLARFELDPVLSAINLQLEPQQLRLSLLRRWNAKAGMK